MVRRATIRQSTLSETVSRQPNSYRHYLSTFHHITPSWEAVVAGEVGGLGRWEQHVEAWRPKTRANTIILRYEDIVSQSRNRELERIADFAGLKPLHSWKDPWAEMHAAGPNFFRRGKADISAEISQEQRSYFRDFSNNGAWVREFGYL